jgi:hypothetical protein
LRDVERLRPFETALKGLPVNDFPSIEPQYLLEKTQTDMLGVWTLPDKGTRAHVARSDKRQVRSTGVAVAGFVKDKASGHNFAPFGAERWTIFLRRTNLGHFAHLQAS